jgi:hypothetical protein
MYIADLFESPIIEPLPTGYGDEKEDQTTLKLADMRKTRLTFAQLNRIRIMNDVKRLEHEKKLDSLAKQYKAPAADAGGM